MNAREFKIGDRVYIQNRDAFGTVWEYAGENVHIKVDGYPADQFTFTYAESELADAEVNDYRKGW
jgi:hypothetical protein